MAMIPQVAQSFARQLSPINRRAVCKASGSELFPIDRASAAVDRTAGTNGTHRRQRSDVPIISLLYEWWPNRILRSRSRLMSLIRLLGVISKMKAHSRLFGQIRDIGGCYITLRCIASLCLGVMAQSPISVYQGQQGWGIGRE